MPLSAFILATPLFGFALTGGDVAAEPPPDTPYGAHLFVPVFAQLEDNADDEEEDEADGGESRSAPAASTRLSREERIRQSQQRNELSAVHRALGIATWASMLVTVSLGFIQYYNQYGFFASRESTPCTSGGAVFGQDQCWGIPWPHRIASFTTSALYAATFTISLILPDPNRASEGDSDFANRLRIHKALRWVHLGGMVAQILLGLATAQNWFGIDRANNYGAQQALATVHMGIGLVTFGTLTAAGALLLF